MSRLLLFCILGCLVVCQEASADLPYSLAYSTYLGGSSWEHARDIFTDAAGFTYVVGGTGSSNFAGASSFPGPNTYNAGQPNSAADAAFGGCDVFITKISPSGQVLWTKYMGGANYDRAYALELDAAGNIYISGRAGRGFPMVNAIQSTFFRHQLAIELRGSEWLRRKAGFRRHGAVVDLHRHGGAGA